MRIPFSPAPVRVAILLALSALGSAGAAPTVPHIFGDHMVLQSGVRLPIWGWAEAGEPLTIRFAGQEIHTSANSQGRWETEIEPLTPSADSRDLVIAGAESITLSDVLVGENWLCSGQSNMEKPLGEQRGQKPVFNAEEEIRLADFPQIRLFKVKKAKSATVARDVTGEWVVCSPATIDAVKFSAAGYFFGRRLFRELKVPVGLIDSTWGGTRIEPWIPKSGYAGISSLSDFAAASGKPGVKVEGSEVSTLYNAMIGPLAPFALRGALWYQGETNIMDLDEDPHYLDKMQALVRGWRGTFQRDLAFYYVQIAPHLYHVVRSATVVSPEVAPRLWEAQAAAQAIPHTGMIVTTDLVDDLADIHPRNKMDVGERLARWALARDYGRTDIEVSGPVYRSMDILGARAVLHFDHVAGGLVSSDNKPLRWFTIAGQDGRFYPATATIEGDTIVTTNPKVPHPTTVRFAWDEAAQPNLANQASLPAVPFRTDNPYLGIKLKK